MSDSIAIRMLDALQAELAKIGVDTSVEWLTSPAPELRVGVPGDPVKAPNQCTIYLQHVGSSLGRDAVGINPLRLDCEFDVWSASSHPEDSSRRAYNLAEDVRRALLRAEDSFYDLFEYGIELGPLSFSGDAMAIRAGTYIVSQRVRIGARNEDDVTEERVKELVQEALMSFDHQRFELDRAVGAQGGTNLPGIRSAGFIEKPWGLSHYVNLPAGANRIFEVCKNWLVQPGDHPGQGRPTFTQRCTFSMLINAGTFGGSPPAGECLVGIEIGSFNTVPPFQTNFASAIFGPVIQFRYNYARAKFELVVWDYDNGVAPLVLDADIQPIFLADSYLKVFKLEYVPAPSGGSVVRAYLNGELAIEYSGSRLQNCYNISNLLHVGYFCTSGSDAGTSVVETGFYENRIWLPDSYVNPTPVNPA